MIFSKESSIVRAAKLKGFTVYYICICGSNSNNWLIVKMLKLIYVLSYRNASEIYDMLIPNLILKCMWDRYFKIIALL